MKATNFIYIIIALLFLPACGGKSMSLKVEPQLGEMGEYIKVDSSELTISLKEIDIAGEKYMAIIPTLPVSAIKNVASEIAFKRMCILVINLDKIYSGLLVFPIITGID